MIAIKHRCFRASIGRAGKPVAALFCAGILAVAPLSARAQSESDLARKTPEQIFQAGWDAPGKIERTIFYSYLARKYPESRFGYYARGHFAEQDGNNALARAHFQKARESDPQFLPAQYRALFLLKGEAKVAAAQALLEKQPDFLNYDLVRVIYFTYKNEMQAPDKARQWLGEWEAKNPEHWIGDYVRGWADEGDGRYQEAEKHYQKAVAFEAVSFDVIQKLTDLRLKRLSDANTPDEQRRQYFQPVLHYMKRHPHDSKPYLYLGDVMRELFHSRPQAFEYYREAFHRHAAADVVTKAVYTSVGDLEEPLLDFLLWANWQLPDNFEIEKQLGRLYAEKQDLTRAENFFRQALAHAPTKRLRTEVALAYSHDFLETVALRPEAGAKLLRELQRTGQGYQPDLLEGLYANALESGNISEAARILKVYEEYLQSKQKINVTWFRRQRRFLTRLMSYRQPQPSRVLLNPEQKPAILPQRNLRISPDGKFMVTGSNPLVLRHAANGQAVRELGEGGTYEWSPNGRFLAVMSADSAADGLKSHVFYVFEVATGRAVVCLPLRAEGRSVSWSSDNQRVAFTDEHLLKIYDMDSRRVSHRERTNAIHTYSRAVWLRDGRLVTGNATEKVLRVWEIKGPRLHLQTTVEGVDWPHALAATPDGRFVLCADNKGMLHRFSTANWQRRSLAIGRMIATIACHPSRPVVVVNDWSRERDNRLSLVDIASMKLLKETTTPQYCAPAFSPHDGSLWGTSEEAIVGYDVSTLVPKTHFSNGTGILQAMSDGAGRNLLMRNRQGLVLWNIDAKKEIKRWDNDRDEGKEWGPLYAVAGSTSIFLSTFPSPAGMHNRITAIDSRTGHTQSIVSVAGEVQAVCANLGENERWIAVGYTWQTEDSDRIGQIAVYRESAGTWKESYKQRVPLVTDDLRYSVLIDPRFSSIAATSDASSIVVTTQWQDGFGMATTRSKVVRVFDGKNGGKEEAIRLDEEIYRAAFDSAGRLHLQTPSQNMIYVRESNGAWQWKSARQIGPGQTWIPLSATAAQTVEHGVMWDEARVRVVNGNDTKEHVFFGNLVGCGIFPATSEIIAVTREGAMYSLPLTP